MAEQIRADKEAAAGQLDAAEGVKDTTMSFRRVRRRGAAASTWSAPTPRWGLPPPPPIPEPFPDSDTSAIFQPTMQFGEFTDEENGPAPPPPPAPPRPGRRRLREDEEEDLSGRAGLPDVRSGARMVKGKDDLGWTTSRPGIQARIGRFRRRDLAAVRSYAHADDGSRRTSSVRLPRKPASSELSQVRTFCVTCWTRRLPIVTR